MSSILTEIYNQLEALAVTYTDKSGASVTPTVYSQETQIDNLYTAQLPCRILMLPSAQGTIEPGGLTKTEWRITDMLLVEAEAQGVGQRDEYPQLTRYCVAYAEKIGTLWRYISGWSVEDNTIGITMAAGKFEFPTGSGERWYGVRCDLVINEII